MERKAVGMEGGCDRGGYFKGWGWLGCRVGCSMFSAVAFSFTDRQQKTCSFTTSLANSKTVALDRLYNKLEFASYFFQRVMN